MSAPVIPDRPRLPWDPPDHFEKRVPDGDNRERLVCARCEFIHYQNPKIVAGAVCTWNDRDPLWPSAPSSRARASGPCRRATWSSARRPSRPRSREAKEEACATIEIDRLLAMYSVARIGQVQIMYRARLVSDDIAPGVESEDVALVDWNDIPWDQLAFPTVVWALAHFHELRAQEGFRDLLQSDRRARPHVAAAQATGLWDSAGLAAFC